MPGTRRALDGDAEANRDCRLRRRARAIRRPAPTFNAKAGGSSRRLARLILMDDPPSLDTGEMTDKGSVNQRAVLSRRAGMIEELYAESPSRRVIL